MKICLSIAFSHFITKMPFSAIQKLILSSLLKKYEGLKQATKMALPVFNASFFKTRLSTAISHFVAK